MIKHIGGFCPDILVVLLFISAIAVACSSQPLPTSTPLPTRTPLPTLPRVAMTPEEREYIEWFDDISVRVSKSIDLFEEAIGSLGANSSDQYAQLIMARELVKLGNIYYEEVAEKTPPRSLIGVHNGLLQALNKYEAATVALEGGSPEGFVINIVEGKEQFFDSGKVYRDWRSKHY